MEHVPLFLLAVAGVIVAGSVGESVFRRTGIPDAIWLIAIGALLGPVGGLVPRSELQRIAPYFAELVLLVVLFEGGSHLAIRRVAPATPRALLLAVGTFVASAATVAAALLGAERAGLGLTSGGVVLAVIAGATLGGSSSVVVLPSMRLARAPERVADLVGLESAFTDALCVVVVTSLLPLGAAAEPHVGDAAAALLAALGVGAVAGACAGLLWIVVARFLRGAEHAYPLQFAALLLLDVVIARLGGSVALGVLAYAVVVGNAGEIGPRLGLAGDTRIDAGVRGFHTQVAFFAKTFFFAFMGASLGGSWPALAAGACLGLLLFAVRIPVARALVAGSDLTRDERALAAVSCPRGLAAGVLATLPAAAGIAGAEALAEIVFPAIAATVLVFAVAVARLRRRAAADAAEPAAAD